MFPLTDDQRMIRDMVREFAAGELEPRAAALDRERRFASEGLSQLAAVDLLGLTIGADYGGAAVDATSWVVALEELARACPSTALVVLAHTALAARTLERFGTEPAKGRWLRALASGQRLGAFALSEPEAGTDVAGMTTTAELQGDLWTLRGRKSFVVGAAGAGLVLVAARVDPDGPPERAFALFAVEREAPGLGVDCGDRLLGMRGAGIGNLTLDGVQVEDGQRVGAPGQGLDLCLEALDAVRLGLAAVCVGIAQAAFERAERYSRERPQFGRPIADHQSVQEHVGDCAVDVTAARAIVRAAAAAGLSRREAAEAKLCASAAASRVCDRAVQVHGGYGYVAEYHVERLYRDAKTCEIAYGTNDVLRLLVAREVRREAEEGVGAPA